MKRFIWLQNYGQNQRTADWKIIMSNIYENVSFGFRLRETMRFTQKNYIFAVRNIGY